MYPAEYTCMIKPTPVIIISIVAESGSKSRPKLIASGELMGPTERMPEPTQVYNIWSPAAGEAGGLPSIERKPSAAHKKASPDAPNATVSTPPRVRVRPIRPSSTKPSRGKISTHCVKFVIYFSLAIHSYRQRRYRGASERGRQESPDQRPPLPQRRSARETRTSGH